MTVLSWLKNIALIVAILLFFRAMYYLFLVGMHYLSFYIK